jgi:hypothetical protein
MREAMNKKEEELDEMREKAREREEEIAELNRSAPLIYYWDSIGKINL